jgi:hypothetical protein
MFAGNLMLSFSLKSVNIQCTARFVTTVCWFAHQLKKVLPLCKATTIPTINPVNVPVQICVLTISSQHSILKNIKYKFQESLPNNHFSSILQLTTERETIGISIY